MKNNKNFSCVFVGEYQEIWGWKEFPGVLGDIDPVTRTNISISESLYEWAMLQAVKENSNISEVVREALVELKGIKCPHCKGEHTRRTGLAHGVGTGPKLPEAISKQYECLDCKKLFNYPRLSKD